MTKAHQRRGLGLALILGVVTALAMASPMTASAAPSVSAAPTAAPCNISGQQVSSSGHGHHLSGIIIAGGISTNSGGCHKPPPEPAYNGTPPLLFNGASAANCVFSPCDNGNVMMTASTGPLVVVPIFWVPSGYSMSASYKSILNSYVADVAKDSGGTQNVFSVANEYYGNNGQIHYNVKLGPVLTDTSPITSGCTLEAADTTGIYADGSGYSACVDDPQLQAEVDSVTAAKKLPHDLSHIYVLYLPKGVESCFLPGETATVGPNGQFCTINHQETAAYCAYHSTDLNSAVYANMAYPIYASPVGFTCGSDARFPVIESPNGNPDADTQVSPLSHELNEALTDPDTETGWYDSHGFENGDECAYIFGQTRGAVGGYYNQVINGGHFLTQEEFTNKVFNASGGKAGCVQSQSAEQSAA
ncbi:MAG TPA: hypothetical protein VF838_05055 [Trebonia sp.]